jgi:hypothetical protein
VNWLKRHWQGIASGICAATATGAAIGLVPVGAPVVIGIGAVCAVLTATHVLDARAVAKAEAKAKELGPGVAGVVAELERLKGKKP